VATLQQVVQLVFEGVDNATETTQKLSAGLNQLGDITLDIAEPFAELAEAIELTAAAVGGAAAVIGVIAIRAASDFSASLQDLNRFLQEGEGEAKDYRDTFQALAVQYGINANEIVQSTADWSAANFKIKDALDLTTLSLKFATAGQLDAAQSTELLKQLMSGLNLTQEETLDTMNRWGDIINTVADISKSDFQELAIAIAGLSPSFNTSGASAEQFAAIINSSVELFQSGSKAADGLRTIIGQITKPTKDAGEALGEFGVTLNDAGVVQGSFFSVLEKIAAKWPTLTEEQQRNAAATLVSAERADQFKNILDAWPRTMEVAETAITKSSGSIANEVERALDTSKAAFASFQQAVNNLVVALGDNLEPVARDVAGAAAALADAFQKLVDSGALQPLFDILQRQGADLANIFRSIAANLTEAFKDVDLSPLTDALEDLADTFGDLFRALFGEIDLTTVEGLASALQTIVNVGAAFVRTLEGIITQLKPFAEGIRSVILGFEDLDDARQIEFGQFLGAMQTISIAGPKIGAALLLIGQTALDMQATVNFAFGVVIVAANAAQVVFDGLAYAAVQGARGFGAYALALAELDAYLNRNAENAQEYRDRADRLRGTLDELGVVAGAIGENFKRNAEELNEGWNRAMGGAKDETEKFREQLQKSEENVKNFGRYAEQTTAKIVDFVNEVGDLGNAIEENLDVDYTLKLDSSAFPQTTKEIAGLTDKFHLFTNAADEAAFGTDQFNSALQKTEGTSEKANQALKKIEWGKSAEGAVKLAENIKRTDGVLIEAGKTAKGYAASLGGVSTEYEQVGTKTVKATGAFAEVKDKTKDAAKALDELIASGKLTTKEFIEVTKNANDFKVKMEEIASDERIKTIEARVTLDVARLEADVERVKSAFASIDSTIAGTGDLLGSLFGLLGDADTYARLDIQNQIDLENQRRQEALDLQKELAKAEIARIEAQIRQLDRGDPWIRIDGTGLAPQLEAFMFEILKAIRTQVNAEFADFLLGTT
jgi:TP901 family phage tail tape measure protein